MRSATLCPVRFPRLPTIRGSTRKRATKGQHNLAPARRPIRRVSDREEARRVVKEIAGRRDAQGFGRSALTEAKGGTGTHGQKEVPAAPSLTGGSMWREPLEGSPWLRLVRRPRTRCSRRHGSRRNGLCPGVPGELPCAQSTNSQSFTSTFIIKPLTVPRTVTRSPLFSAAAFFARRSSKKHCTSGISNCAPLPRMT